MAIVKKRNEQTESRLLLESDEPVELPPAEVDERALVVQFEQHKPFVPELLETLREGALAELVPVMRDGSTFAIHTRTRTFWVKLWHSSAELTRVERVQVLSCLPSTRGVRIVTPATNEFEEDYEDEDYDEADEDFDEDDADAEGNEKSDDAATGASDERGGVR